MDEPLLTPASDLHQQEPLKGAVPLREQKDYLLKHKVLLALLIFANLTLLALGITLAAYGAISDASVYKHHDKRHEYKRFLWVFNGVSGCGGVQIVLAVFGLYVSIGLRPNTAPETKSGLFNLLLLVYVPVLFGFAVAAFVLGIRSFMFSLGHHDDGNPAHDHFHDEIGRDFRYNCALAGGSLLAAALSAYASSALANLIPPSGLSVEVVDIINTDDAQLRSWGRKIDAAEGTEHPGAWDGQTALHLMRLYSLGGIPGSGGVVLRVRLAPEPSPLDTGADVLTPDVQSGRGRSYSRSGRRLHWDEEKADFVVDASPSSNTARASVGPDHANDADDTAFAAGYRPLLEPQARANLGRSLPTISAPFQPVEPTIIDVGDDGDGSKIDDTVAFVFVTIIETYDLTSALKKSFWRFTASLFRQGGLCAGLCAAVLTVLVSRTLNGHAIWQWLCLRFGLVGFQWPFHGGVFLANVLEGDKNETTARVMRALANWNYYLPSDSPHKCAIMLLPSLISEAVYHMYSRGFFMSSELTPTAMVNLKPFREQALKQAKEEAVKASKQKARKQDGQPPTAVSEAVDDATLLKWAYEKYLASLKKSRRKDPTVRFEQMGGRMYLFKNFGKPRRMSDVRRDSVTSIQPVTRAGVATGESEAKQHEELKLASQAADDRDQFHSITSQRSSASGGGSGETNTLLAPTKLFFEQISDGVPVPFRTLMVLAYQGRIIASSVLFHFPSAKLMTSDIHGMDHDGSREVSAYFVMMYQAVKYALAQGCNWVDFGPTTLQPKVSVGSRLVDCSSGFYAESVILRFLVMSGTRAFVKKQKKSAANKPVEGAAMALDVDADESKEEVKVVVEPTGGVDATKSGRPEDGDSKSGGTQRSYIPPIPSHGGKPTAGTADAAASRPANRSAPAKEAKAAAQSAAEADNNELGRGELRRLKKEEKKKRKKEAKGGEVGVPAAAAVASATSVAVAAPSIALPSMAVDVPVPSEIVTGNPPLSKRQQKKLARQAPKDAPSALDSDQAQAAVLSGQPEVVAAVASPTMNFTIPQTSPVVQPVVRPNEISVAVSTNPAEVGLAAQVVYQPTSQSQ